MLGFLKAKQKLFLSFSTAAMLFLIYDRYFADTHLPFHLMLLIAAASYMTIASDVIVAAFKILFKHKRMSEQFLMMIATFGAFMLKDYPEALAVMIFYKIGQIFEEYASASAHREISSLVSLKPTQVRLAGQGGEEILVKPRMVKIGDIIRVLKGEVVAIDGYLIEDSAAIDTKALTGESEPVLYKKGDLIPSGCINQGNVITLKVNTLHKNSSITRLLNMIEDAAANKSKPETLITRFARWYTPLVVLFACILAAVPLFVEGANFYDWVERALVFLVVSCPCALVLSVPLTFFGGLGAISRLGVMIKGTVHIESLAHLKAVAFDKTGTLTHGNFRVVSYKAVNCSVQELFSIAGSLESSSTHPVALSVLEYVREHNYKIKALSDVTERSGMGLEAIIDGKKAAAGRAEFIKEYVSDFLSEEQNAATVIYVAYDNRYLGYIELFDEIKENAFDALEQLRKLKIRLCLISGDNEGVVLKVCKSLNLDEYCAKQSPEQKIAKFKAFLDRVHEKGSGRVAYVGDGLNDAPVIALADVGISMGKIGSASAVEASDVVIMNDNLSSLVKAVELSKRTYALALTNLYFVMSVKFLILFAGAAGFASIWLAIFGDVGVLVLAVLNAMRSLRFR